MVTAVALVADYLPDAWTVVRSERGVKDVARQLREETGRPVVVGSVFGAWPRGGAGGPLLEDIVHELRTSHVSMVVVARDERLAQTYTNAKYHGVRLDPARPLIVGWVNAKPDPTDPDNGL